jgi:hypothetical protein
VLAAPTLAITISGNIGAAWCIRDADAIFFVVPIFTDPEDVPCDPANPSTPCNPYNNFVRGPLGRKYSLSCDEFPFG